MKKPVYRIDVDRLVLQGPALDRSQAERLRVLLERGLAERLSAGVSAEAGGDLLRLRAPDLRLDDGTTEASMAEGVAQVVAAALQSRGRD